MSPVGGVPTEPLRHVLRQALDEIGISVYEAARRLNALNGSRTRDSWERSLRRYLAEKNPQIPNRTTARLLSEVFGKPADYFVRPQRRESIQEERDRLVEERDDLLRRLEEAERRAGE